MSSYGISMGLESELMKRCDQECDPISVHSLQSPMVLTTQLVDIWDLPIKRSPKSEDVRQWHGAWPSGGARGGLRGKRPTPGPWVCRGCKREPS